MSDPTTEAEQDNEMRQLLWRMELAGDGGTQRWGGPGRGGEQEMPGPRGDEVPLYEELRIAYSHSRTWTQRQVVIDVAKREVAFLRRVKPPEVKGETREQMLARLVRDERVVDLSPDQVTQTGEYAALRPREVVSARLRAGLAPDTGRQLAPVVVGGDKAVEIARMRGKGMSVRQIALRLGLPKSTIQDLSSKAA